MRSGERPGLQDRVGPASGPGGFDSGPSPPTHPRWRTVCGFTVHAVAAVLPLIADTGPARSPASSASGSAARPSPPRRCSPAGPAPPPTPPSLAPSTSRHPRKSWRTAAQYRPRGRQTRHIPMPRSGRCSRPVGALLFNILASNQSGMDVSNERGLALNGRDLITCATRDRDRCAVRSQCAHAVARQV
jgi:hypothetical protein